VNIGVALFIVSLVALAAFRFLLPKTTAPRADVSGLDPRLIMAIVVSIVILGAGLYVILATQGGQPKYPEGTQKWAFGAVGSVLGFWLKP
jgi:hypothetical protein